jgi:hypothetical protein
VHVGVWVFELAGVWPSHMDRILVRKLSSEMVTHLPAQNVSANSLTAACAPSRGLVERRSPSAADCLLTKLDCVHKCM